MASMTVAPVLTNTRRVGELNKSLENSYLLPLKRQMTAPKGGLYTVKKFSAVTRLVARVSAPPFK